MQKYMIRPFVVGVLMLGLQPAHAAEPAEDLAKKNGCLLCHSIQAAIVGPAYKDVAKKYKGDKGAEERLVAKVKAGGSGVWGKMPMPANSPQVKDEDIQTIVKWVLTLN